MMIQLQDPDICEGDVGAQGPVIAYAVRRMSSNGRTARLFCHALFGMCDVEPVEPYDFPMPPPLMERRGDVERKAEAGQVVRREPFKVVHISDVHIDRFYTVRIFLFSYPLQHAIRKPYRRIASPMPKRLRGHRHFFSRTRVEFSTANILGAVRLGTDLHAMSNVHHRAT